MIHDNEVTCRVLEGEEENEYLAKVLKDMNASKNKFNKSKRGARGSKKGTEALVKKSEKTVPNYESLACNYNDVFAMLIPRNHICGIRIFGFR